MKDINRTKNEEKIDCGRRHGNGDFNCTKGGTRSC